jgi:hypothetical protein
LPTHDENTLDLTGGETLLCSWYEKIERLILGKAYRVRARLTFFLLDLYNFSNTYHKKVKDFNTISGTLFNDRFKASMFFRNSGSYLSGGRRWSSSSCHPV